MSVRRLTVSPQSPPDGISGKAGKGLSDIHVVPKVAHNIGTKSLFKTAHFECHTGKRFGEHGTQHTPPAGNLYHAGRADTGAVLLTQPSSSGQHVGQASSLTCYLAGIGACSRRRIQSVADRPRRELSVELLQER